LILGIGSGIVLLRQQPLRAMIWPPNAPLLFTLWSIAYLALHLFTTIQVWDRYLLPLAPMVALWIGWLAGRWQLDPVNPDGSHKAPKPFLYAILNLLVGLALLPPALSAARGELPIGGDHGAYAGLREALAWVQQTASTETVLYHRTLGWQAQFYLYDEIAAEQVALRWFPHAVYLVDNALKTPHRHKLWIEPDWSPLRDLAFQARVRGLTVRAAARFGHFTVYELTQAPLQPCSWCACAPRSPFPQLLPDMAVERSCRP
jgi:hypothetical protein